MSYVSDECVQKMVYLSAALLREKYPSPGIRLMLRAVDVVTRYTSLLATPSSARVDIPYSGSLGVDYPCLGVSLADIFYKTNTHLSGFGEFELCFLLTLW